MIAAKGLCKVFVRNLAKKKGMKVILVKQQGRKGDYTKNPLLTSRWFAAELDKIGKEMAGDAAYDYVLLAELDNRKNTLEERLLEIYEEI